MSWTTTTCRNIEGALNIYIFIHLLHLWLKLVHVDWLKHLFSLHLMFLITAWVLFNAAFSFFQTFISLSSDYIIVQICSKPSVPSKFANVMQIYTSVLCQGSHQNIFSALYIWSVFEPIPSFQELSLSAQLNTKYLLFSQFLAHLIIFPMFYWHFWDTSQ